MTVRICQATSGYFRRGRSWGPVYSVTTLESTNLETLETLLKCMFPRISRASWGEFTPTPRLPPMNAMLLVLSEMNRSLTIRRFLKAESAALASMKRFTKAEPVALTTREAAPTPLLKPSVSLMVQVPSSVYGDCDNTPLKEDIHLSESTNDSGDRGRSTTEGTPTVIP